MNLGSVEYVHTRFVAKRPRDPAQTAKQVFDIAMGELRAVLGIKAPSITSGWRIERREGYQTEVLMGKLNGPYS